MFSAAQEFAPVAFHQSHHLYRDGRIAVLQFHGVPDREHPWVHTRPERFEEYMRYLHTNAFTVIALRDLARYVDADRSPKDPLVIIEKRKATVKAGALTNPTP